MTGHSFLPLVIEEGGLLDPDFSKFILKTADSIASESLQQSTGVFTFWRQQFALANLL